MERARPFGDGTEGRGWNGHVLLGMERPEEEVLGLVSVWSAGAPADLNLDGRSLVDQLLLLDVRRLRRRLHLPPSARRLGPSHGMIGHVCRRLRPRRRCVGACAAGPRCVMLTRGVMLTQHRKGKGGPRQWRKALLQSRTIPPEGTMAPMVHGEPWDSAAQRGAKGGGGDRRDGGGGDGGEDGVAAADGDRRRTSLDCAVIASISPESCSKFVCDGRNARALDGGNARERRCKLSRFSVAPASPSAGTAAAPQTPRPCGHTGFRQRIG